LRTAKNLMKNGSSLYVRTVRGMGRGVFAGRRFRAGEVIEVCPVLLISESMERKCRDEIIDKYIFEWDKTGDVAAIAFGFGSLYNHSADPNATFGRRKRDKVIVFRATRTIAKGEQIFVDYDWYPEDFHFPAEPPTNGTTKAGRAAVHAVARRSAE
jgi:SET domain-containing protein